jgi:phospholipase A1/A2
MRVAAFGAALVACAGVRAQPSEDPVRCITIEEPAARLACYDRAHGRGGSSAPPAAAAAHSPPLLALPNTATADAAATARAAARSPMQLSWDLDRERDKLFQPRAYKPVYLLPATYTSSVNRRPSSPAPGHSVESDQELRPLEAKYQLSLKSKFSHRVFGLPMSLWGAYTQSSRWQVYNGADSRPFRETNYEPELILVTPLSQRVAGWDLRMASVALNHQSNGRALPLSRSWNRVILGLGAERGPWTLELRPWLRIKEGLAEDDNPDLSDYAGRGELRVQHAAGEHHFIAQLRHSLRGGAASRGSAQLEWVFPITGVLHGHVQLFHGYGESLVDYNVRQTKFGIGVTIAGWR